ncbi:MAG: hypothetical protein K0Q49_2243 [Haloplasmataceae bacterium]|jgi:hypothetical protein|nr:hypothetical protein [Haloplasmataceae bacterium]
MSKEKHNLKCFKWRIHSFNTKFIQNENLIIENKPIEFDVFN